MSLPGLHGTEAGPAYESTTDYTWDAGDRLTEADDSVTGTISLDYDDLDRLVEEDTPEGLVTYTWDDADRLTAITQGSDTVSLAYDASGRRTSVTLPNGIATLYTRDAASQLTRLTYQTTGALLGTLDYAYDSSGRRRTAGGSFARTGLPATLSPTTYNANNQLTEWNSTTLTYDANGNLTGDGTNTHTWNARNQLASISGGVSASFAYDPFGRRVSKTVGATTTGYLYDGANVVQELSGATPAANLLSGRIDEIFLRTDGAGTRQFLTDALGSTLALTDGSAAIQTEYAYAPFGETTASGTSTTSSYPFTGRENDGTGLYYYRARYYSPELQRFISDVTSGKTTSSPNGTAEATDRTFALRRAFRELMPSRSPNSTSDSGC